MVDSPDSKPGQEPQPVIPLEYAGPSAESRGRRWLRANQVFLILGMVMCPVAWAMILFSTESVLGTGPIIFAIGIFLLAGGLYRRRPAVWLQGCGHCSICLLFVGLVNWLEWSPGEAHQPFLIMGGIYSAAALIAGVLILSRKEAI